jgi:hypothetical protein
MNTVKPHAPYNRLRAIALAALLFAALTGGARAQVTISSAASANIACVSGVCSPTAKQAVLSAAHLEALLAKGDLKVTTTGAGGIQAGSIIITAPLKSSTAHTLALRAYTSILIEAPVSVDGAGGIALNDNIKTPSLAFYGTGNITFADLSSSLTINGSSYGLVGSVAALAKAVAANPNANYALAKSYDAAGDGTYNAAPVTTVFNGNLEGLGNTIKNLKIVDPTASGAADALFAFDNGTISNLGLVDISVTSTGTEGANYGGTFVAIMGQTGVIWRSYAIGTVNVQELSGLGGLTENGGSFIQSYANVALNGTGSDNVGGLTASTRGAITQSFSIGPISIAGDYNSIGGLVGGTAQGAAILESYSASPITLTNGTAANSNVGGLVGVNGGVPSTMTQSYAWGAITVPTTGCTGANCVGGVIGQEICAACDPNASTYWDTTTTKAKLGVGNLGSDKGIRGLPNTTLVAKLPPGFAATVWAENSAVNNGLPYLIANPPP